MSSLLIPFVVVTSVAWTGLMSIVVVGLFLLSPRWGHSGERAWARFLLWLIGIRVRWVGLERLPPGASILAPNHASMFDILVLCTLPLDFKYIAKRSISKIPLLGFTLKTMGTYWVDRNKSGKDIQVMKSVEDGLKRGTPVLIFPEGTRSRTGELLPFKKGAFKTALNTGVPLVPIAIRGTYSIAPPGKLPAHRGHDVEVIIGEPWIVPSSIPLETVMTEFRSTLIGLLEAPRHVV